MAVKILVASPIPSFGELIRSTLTSHGDYQVLVCETGDQVLDALAGSVFDVLILDAAISDQPFAPLVQKIIASLPAQKIAIIPPENKPDHPSLENVTAHGFLFRPFLDPDLINLVQRLAASAEQDRANQQAGLRDRFPDSQEQISWADDPTTAAADLSRLLLGSSALAGLVIRSGALFVHAGRISEQASLEINQMLTQVRSDKEKDLVRFTFLVADDCEALVYAVHLAIGWTLALVYDVSMPLTRVRSQATALASKLRENIRLEDVIENAAGVIPAPDDKSSAGAPASTAGEVDISAIMDEINSGEDLSGDENLNISSLDDELFSLINEINEPPVQETEPAAKEEAEKAGSFDSIYTRASQNGQPGSKEQQQPVEMEEPAEEPIQSVGEKVESTSVTQEIKDAEAAMYGQAPPEEKPDFDHGEIDTTLNEEITADEEEDLSEMEAALKEIHEEPAPDIQAMIDQKLADQSLAVQEAGQSERPEQPGSSAQGKMGRPHIFSRITPVQSESRPFTVVLVPRHSEHFLTGEIAGFLGDILKNASHANPWKLAGVSIRPGYLKLDITISEYLDPEEIIQFIKDYTGNALAGRFPGVGGGDGQDDFWADETLKIPDHTSLDGDRLQEFIQSVRSGAAKPA